MTPGGSKFFTWTKGDRKHASAGMVQIPVECIEIKGMSYGRNARGSRKNGRKPLPLSFSDTRSDYSAQSHDSFTLHEAAVQSATSLIAAMSDMLKSPHFNGGPKSGELRPPQGRLRSHTAPPSPATPLVEAPHPEPVELPGTESTWLRCRRGASILARTPPLTSELQEMEVMHPKSISPRGPARPPAYDKIQLSDHDQDSNVERASLDSTLCRKSEDCSGTPNRSQESLAKSDTSGLMKTPQRHIPRTPRQDHETEVPTRALEICTQSVNPQCSSYIVSEASDLVQGNISNVPGMMAQVANMRAAHEAHIATLKAAHDQEITSYRAYVAIFERQHNQLQLAEPRQPLSIDTGQHCGRAIGGSDASRTSSLQSLESLSTSSARSSSDSIAGSEALKRKLDLANKTNADLSDVRRERDQLKDSDNQKQRRIAQLKNIISKTQKNEHAQKTAVASLQADLAAANMQRVDVLAGLDDAYKDLRSSYQRERRLRERCEELQSHLKATKCMQSALLVQGTPQLVIELDRHDGDKFDVTKCDSAVPHASTNDLVVLGGNGPCRREMCQEIRSRLETVVTNVKTLQAQFARCQHNLKAAQDDRERYNTLLHTELRRQSKAVVQKGQVATPEIQQEIATLLTSRLQGTSAFIGPKELESGVSVSTRDQAWEQELRHCVEELIMYKLDVKGYKKDLKLANARIEALEAELQSTTAGRRAHERHRSHQDHAPLERDSRSSSEQRPGLGIPWKQQRSSSTPNAQASSHHTRAGSNTPVTTMPSCISPRRQPTTALGVHKQLPLPPPPQGHSPHIPTSLSPAAAHPKAQIQRAETLRSLSDSIISSYAKRDEPTFPIDATEQSSSATFPPPRPLRAARGGGGFIPHPSPPSCGMESGENFSRGHSAVLMPISRFSSGMPRTPN
ncbi:hypothetical protein CERZMDRAFT_95618 [Cercospora zeae-maydis SCOH1-5]|uniref:Uncharacterized protein n=1 Tax=Cercospora zeae-maydis SCOH1-5 TaxID=717836 RepID=A0A6A6FLK3_9PEZI|nr:hypothetical protein CERZMDRAFT_95618 [Cercospora zeae-maydis SCOH1-5]